MVRIVDPGYEIWTQLDGDYILKFIEKCARNCYKSEGAITDDSAAKMVRKLIELGHTAMLEHFNITVKITCDLGCYKDITRHRHVSYAIESTRYCNYFKDKFGSEITVVKPCHIQEGTEMYKAWYDGVCAIEQQYMKMCALGAKADQARMLLPHSVKADVVMTANLREWRHVLSLRTAPAAHPTVQQIMKALLNEFKQHIPVVFDDIGNDLNTPLQKIS